MGTRHLIAVVKDGDFRIANYGQWDGYPDGQGVDIVRFLRVPGNIDRLSAGLANVVNPTQEDFERLYAEVGHNMSEGNGWFSLDVSKKFSKRNPSLSRDAGSDILELVSSSTGPIFVRDARGFAGDSLFCEWAYVIDLDAMALEVYRGFNNQPTPPESRFPSGAMWLEKTGGYEPVSLVATFSVFELPEPEDFAKHIYAITDPDQNEVA